MVGDGHEEPNGTCSYALHAFLSLLLLVSEFHYFHFCDLKIFLGSVHSLFNRFEMT